MNVVLHLNHILSMMRLDCTVRDADYQSAEDTLSFTAALAEC